MSTFAERVELLAKRLQIPHPLLERYLGVESIELSGGEIVYALACNKSSRLFFQALAVAELGQAYHLVHHITVTEEIEQQARDFYGEELWNDEPHTGKHPIIDGIRNAKDNNASIRIGWKRPDGTGYAY